MSDPPPEHRRVRRRKRRDPDVPLPGPPAERARPDKGERSLRGLIGPGSTQVSVSAAMRARDIARPTDEELAAAEDEVTIVRRHYRPD